MKIKNVQTYNMKGRLIDLIIKKKEVDCGDKYKVLYFLNFVTAISIVVENSNNINNDIQKYISSIAREIKPLTEEQIELGLSDLNKYFDLNQLKYLKIIAIASISRDYYNGFSTRIMSKYF